MINSQATYVMTLANSIIGVSILAMPYCFKQCGILLSIFLLLISSAICRLTCHFLLKSAIIVRRRTFEFLAFHAFGSLGKFIAEIGMIGLLMGTCVAFFVVMGDLAPEIIAKISGTRTTETLRTSILMALALFCILPLGLLRNVDSLASVCTASIGFYFCLVLKIIAESIPHIISGDWYDKVSWWRPDGILQCLPIFSMALFCQTQLFEIYQAIPNASLDRMNELIKMAVNICASVYIFVGTFGYIACSEQTFGGNILMSFKPSVMAEVMKIGFVISVAFSFPLVIFPCRASLYSLLYRRMIPSHEGATNYIPEGKFKGLTFIIVFISLVTGVLIPNIEFVLGLLGSTIGTMICIIFPATCFICISFKNTNERILAQVMLFIGVLVMVLGTYANLYAMEENNLNVPIEKTVEVSIAKSINELKINMDIPSTAKNIIESPKIEENLPQLVNEIVDKGHEILKNDNMKEIRHEPPQPEEPADMASAESKLKDNKKLSAVVETFTIQQNKKPAGTIPLPNIDIKAINNLLVQDPNVDAIENKNLIDNAVASNLKLDDEKKSIDNNKIGNIVISDASLKLNASHKEAQKIEEVDIEAIKKEDHELQEEEKEQKKKDEEIKLNLLKTIEKQNEAQQKLFEQQKQVLEEIKQRQEAFVKDREQTEIDKVNQKKVEAVQEIESIAKKAIESLGKKDDVSFMKNEPITDVKNSMPKSVLSAVPIPIAKSTNMTQIYSLISGANVLADRKSILNDNVTSQKKGEKLDDVQTKILQDNAQNIRHEPAQPIEPVDDIEIKQNKQNILSSKILSDFKDSGNKAKKVSENINRSENIQSLNDKHVPSNNNVILPVINQKSISPVNLNSDIDNKKEEMQGEDIVHREIRSINEQLYFNELTDSKHEKLIVSDIQHAHLANEACEKDQVQNINIHKDVTNSPLIKMVSKLSEPEFVDIKLNQFEPPSHSVVDTKDYRGHKRK